MVRWLSPAPAVTAARLSAALGLPLAAERDGLELVLANAVIEVVADAVGPAGGRGYERLSIPGVLTPAADLGSGTERTAATLSLVAIGIATVDAERLAGEHGLEPTQLAPDLALGAACWQARAGEIAAVILEPNTEGRIAASLARFGEGPVVLYLAGGRGGSWSGHRATARGPFGRGYDIAGWPAWGPHVAICEFVAPPPGTIDR